MSQHRVDKRTIEASYVYELTTLYGKEYPTTFQVLSRYLSKYGYTDAQIQRIVDEEVFDTVVSAMRYGDYLASVLEIVKRIARIEYKSVSEINASFEKVLAQRFGVSTCSVDVYNEISPALKRLVKEGLVDVQDHPDNSRWNMYKYVG